MASVFLSYDHEDVVAATSIARALEQAGHTVWYDRHIQGGAQYSRKIEQALDRADAVVVLWSERSLDSPWVRDEAAEGRDRGKLIPLSLGGAVPPMGFRQFQTIPLGAWKGRGKVPLLARLLEAVASQSEQQEHTAGQLQRQPSHAPPETSRPTRGWLIAAAAAVLVVAAWIGWDRFRGAGLPVVQVVAGDQSQRSAAAASDLYVKLGSLAQVGEGKWQLVDANSSASKPTYVFRAADVGSSMQPRSNLVLTDGPQGSLLWSREFVAPAGGQADLRQQLSMTAGRVLGCALESREAGGLARDLLKLFLNACAAGAELSMNEPGKIISPLRSVVAAKPKFIPAWSRLIYAGTSLIDVSTASGSAENARAIRQLKTDIETVRAFAPDLPELTLARVYLLPPRAFEQRLHLLEAAAGRAPDNATILGDLVGALQSVGRMGEAAEIARRAAELDPLSPAMTTSYIMALAYSGQTARAREELVKAEKLWTGTNALRDAQWGFHLRYGDPKLAKRLSTLDWPALNAYLDARSNPSPGNVATMTALFAGSDPNEAGNSFAIQAFGEFGQVDLAFDRLFRAPADAIAYAAYVLYRPGLASLRRDARFMRLAKRIGLVDYWRSSGRWPDYCSDPQLPYDCKAEAAKHGA